MAKTLLHRFMNRTASFTLHAVDRSALWVDHLNRKVLRSFRRRFGG
ncbi:MAG: hypothetical protein JST04_02800 [Bdellovibrionales bacterium]|nr:hypothetical protein [Bdellovibrionales bacterium]